MKKVVKTFEFWSDYKSDNGNGFIKYSKSRCSDKEGIC